MRAFPRRRCNIPQTTDPPLLFHLGQTAPAIPPGRCLPRSPASPILNSISRHSEDRHRCSFNEPGHAHELTFTCYRRFRCLSAE